MVTSYVVEVPELLRTQVIQNPKIVCELDNWVPRNGKLPHVHSLDTSVRFECLRRA